MLVIFSLWQFNDPDPWFWISIYGYAALLAGLAAFNKYYRYWALAGAVLFFLGFLYLYPSSVSEWVQQEWTQQDLSMKTESMEQARESFGLLIAALVLALVSYGGWRSRKIAY
ncbi:transmembrane 220 family protein [Pontibacter harenae]|uniref:transmembrane 220 family protein n=1 Tax=Pontibacter harenae TaxID=2894083 RepID=UPI001E34DD9C|nr:transmembrane 220 family protein [Pontibacter harenae]